MVNIATPIQAPSSLVIEGRKNSDRADPMDGRRPAMPQHAPVSERREMSVGKDNLVSMCAHDLRNPLSSVCGLAEFLLDPSIGSLNPEQIELVASILEASHGMLKIVNLLLDNSIMEAGKLKLTLAPASLREFAQKAVFMAAVVATRKGTRIVLQPCSSDEPVLMIEETRIREVVDNLLSNAVKYSPPGSCIRVMIDTLPASAGAGAQIRFSVRDEGPGIPAAERDLLFRDFSRLSACPTGGEKSTGLGLAICRRIIDLHNGCIDAVNHPEGGCVFSFRLPIPPCN